MDMEEMTDSELDQARRDVLKEQERRQELARGLEAIGQRVKDYAHAAHLDPVEGDPAEVGRDVIEHATGHRPEVPAEDEDA